MALPAYNDIKYTHKLHHRCLVSPPLHYLLSTMTTSQNSCDTHTQSCRHLVLGREPLLVFLNRGERTKFLTTPKSRLQSEEPSANGS